MPNLFKKCFDVDYFLKSLLNLLQYCYCCLCSGFVAWRHVVILAARSETEPATPALKSEVLTIGSPEKSVHV